LLGQNNDVYFQVGLLITTGLAARNAILVVQFAKINFEKGMTAYEAVYEADQRRT
jgi:multidrug efflux pump